MSESSLGHERAVLLNTFLQKDLSENTELKIAKVIKNTIEKFGSREADLKAKEITQIINSCKTEAEILAKIKDIH